MKKNIMKHRLFEIIGQKMKINMNAIEAQRKTCFEFNLYLGMNAIQSIDSQYTVIEDKI